MKDDWQSMSSKTLRHRIKNSSPGSSNWMAATHELSTRKGITPTVTLIVALLTRIVALGAWFFPRNLSYDQNDSSNIESSSLGTGKQETKLESTP